MYLFKLFWGKGNTHWDHSYYFSCFWLTLCFSLFGWRFRGFGRLFNVFRFLFHNFYSYYYKILTLKKETILGKIRETNYIPIAIVPFVFPFRTPFSYTYCTMWFSYDRTNKAQLGPHTLLRLFLQLGLPTRRKLSPTSNSELVLLYLHTHQSLF